MTLNCNGTLIDLQTPKVMGILNITPDSFYDGGQFNELDTALKQTEKMLAEGATFIDIGAASSKPGSALISPEQEADRLFPLLEGLIKRFPKTLFSVDTYNSSIAKQALKRGVSLINDISGGELDQNMLEAVAQFSAPYVCMHMQGTPEDMQLNPSYDSVVEEQLYFFAQKIEQMNQLGINDIIIDPGFGFGKTLEHNYTILKNLHQYHNLNTPILVGISRKSMVYKRLNIAATEALNGSTSLHTVALLKGANILRVHDVKEAMEVVELLQALN